MELGCCRLASRHLGTTKKRGWGESYRNSLSIQLFPYRWTFAKAADSFGWESRMRMSWAPSLEPFGARD
ncbi:hypothetical protein CEXT_541171 [Caerostris extrusa]|uniref:Uncharacterized protein n=1 Tax=Caerostris extrusa TaxID=172846 RepID=A0AAV4S0M8_CAEEX|nr:hypothetical protein CEXT_541171 [Caerostris extrusa]